MKFLSLAAGADQIFARAVLDGGQLDVISPRHRGPAARGVGRHACPRLRG
jgi:hypothetical protein